MVTLNKMADNGVVKFRDVPTWDNLLGSEVDEEVCQQLKTWQSMFGSEVNEEVCQIRYVGVVKFPEVPTWNSIEVVYKTTQTCICKDGGRNEKVVNFSHSIFNCCFLNFKLYFLATTTM